MPPLLAVRDLSLTLEGTRILEAVDLTVERGRIHAVVGPSGSGKTSLLRAIVRLDEPSAGQIRLDGEDVRQLEPRELRRRVAWVPQVPAFTEATVLENALVGPRLRDGDSADEGRALELLERVGLDDRADQPVEELSGGERQRLGLVRTLIINPEVLLLDEPTANLDRDLEGEVEDLIVEVVGSERAGLWVTHAPEQARRVADRVTRLVGGRVVDSGGPSEVIA